MRLLCKETHNISNCVLLKDNWYDVSTPRNTIPELNQWYYKRYFYGEKDTGKEIKRIRKFKLNKINESTL